MFCLHQSERYLSHNAGIDAGTKTNEFRKLNAFRCISFAVAKAAANYSIFFSYTAEHRWNKYVCMAFVPMMMNIINGGAHMKMPDRIPEFMIRSSVLFSETVFGACK